MLELRENLPGRPAFAAVRLRQTLADRGQIFELAQPVEQLLVRLGVLKHKLRSAIDGEHLGALALLEPMDVLFVVPEEVGQRVDLAQIKHGRLRSE